MAQFQHNKQAQVMARLTELLGVPVIVKLKDIGERRGVIEQIVAPALAEDFRRSIDFAQFKVKLESGDTITVSGSELSRIDAGEALTS